MIFNGDFLTLQDRHVRQTHLKDVLRENNFLVIFLKVAENILFSVLSTCFKAPRP